MIRRCPRALLMWRTSFAVCAVTLPSWEHGPLRAPLCCCARRGSARRAFRRATCPAGCTWSSSPKRPRNWSRMWSASAPGRCSRGAGGVGGSRGSTCCAGRSSLLPSPAWSGPLRCRGHDGDRSRRHRADPRADGLACSARRARNRPCCARRGVPAVSDRPFPAPVTPVPLVPTFPTAAAAPKPSPDPRGLRRSTR